jgi:hypothetical protein
MPTTTNDSDGSKPSIEHLKARLDKIGRTPSGSIPTEKLKAVSERVLPHMELFCSYAFPKGRLSPSGRYWETPKVFVQILSNGKVHALTYNMRISLEMGGFYDWDDPKCRYPIGNPLLLWMISGNVVLNDEWKVVSRKDLARSVQELNEWVDEVERSGQTFIKPEEDPDDISAIREIVSMSVEFGKAFSAKKIWESVVKKVGIDECKSIPQLASHYRLYQFLKDWVEEDKGILYYGGTPELCSITEKSVSRKTTFTFSASPECRRQNV